LSPKRALVAGTLFAAVAAWAVHWTNRFFEARSRGEAALDSLQPSLRQGWNRPAMSSRIDAALADSHFALLMALSGPLLVILPLFAAVWLSGRERR
jgi:hypothetical protein